MAVTVMHSVESVLLDDASNTLTAQSIIIIHKIAADTQHNTLYVHCYISEQQITSTVLTAIT